MKSIQEAQQEITTFYVNNITYNEEIYFLLKNVGENYLANGENIPEVEKKLINNTLKQYNKIGISLPRNDQDALKKLFIEIEQLALEFAINIQKTDNHILADDAQLSGLTEAQKKTTC